MKATLLKALVLALYVATLMTVWSMSGWFGDLSLLVVTFTLAYCGIIVLSQLVTTVVDCYRSCVAASRNRSAVDLTAAPVAFETETEAT